MLDFMGVSSELYDVRLVYRQSAVRSDRGLTTIRFQKTWRAAVCIPKDVMRSGTTSSS